MQEIIKNLQPGGVNSNEGGAKNINEKNWALGISWGVLGFR